jgi:hypothetical protein
MADVTSFLYRRMRDDGYGGSQFQFIYVDEVRRPGQEGGVLALHQAGCIQTHTNSHKTHRLYGAQVQDLTPAQIALLRFLCPSPATGFVLAGDTAQVRAPAGVGGGSNS